MRSRTAVKGSGTVVDDSYTIKTLNTQAGTHPYTIRDVHRVSVDVHIRSYTSIDACRRLLNGYRRL